VPYSSPPIKFLGTLGKKLCAQQRKKALEGSKALNQRRGQLWPWQCFSEKLGEKTISGLLPILQGPGVTSGQDFPLWQGYDIPAKGGRLKFKETKRQDHFSPALAL
jgi:hypothetical protein